jgi:agmatine deiminase
MESTPRGDGLHMPAEWSPHERTIMTWPARRALWGDRLAEAGEVYALVARTIAEHEPVTMVADPPDAEAAAAACGPSVEVTEIGIDDSWARDSGPIGVIGADGRRAAVDFVFNGWGRKFAPWDRDDALARHLARRLGLARYRAPFVLEGGAVAVDGEGTAIVTEQCLLHPNRNPNLTRRQIEQGLGDYLGVERVIWIPFGLAADDDTDGHVDNVACFTARGAVLLQGCDDDGSPDNDRLAINRRCLEGAIDAGGRAIEVAEVPVLPVVATARGPRPVPYLNFYVANGVVVVPVSGHPADDEALAQIGACYRGRAVVGVPGTVLALGGGGVHCVTQQVPSGAAHPGGACS